MDNNEYGANQPSSRGGGGNKGIIAAVVLGAVLLAVIIFGIMLFGGDGSPLGDLVTDGSDRNPSGDTDASGGQGSDNSGGNGSDGGNNSDGGNGSDGGNNSGGSGSGGDNSDGENNSGGGEGSGNGQNTPQATEGLVFELLEDGSYAVVNYTAMTAEVYIPDEYLGAPVSEIGDYAFDDCYFIKSVRLPSGLKSIGVRAFDDCRALTELELPDEIERVGDYAFKNCPLKTVEDDGFLYLGNPDNPYLVLMSQKAEEKLYCDVREGTRVIYSDAFNGKQLYGIRLPASLKYIGKSAFDDYSGHVVVESLRAFFDIEFSDEYANPLHKGEGDLFEGRIIPSETKGYEIEKTLDVDLVNFTVPEGVKVLKSYVLARLPKMESLTLPASLEKIESFAIFSGEKLNYIEIPEGVSRIDSYALAGSLVKRVKVNSSSVSFGVSPFNSYSIEEIDIPGVQVITNTSDSASSVINRWLGFTEEEREQLGLDITSISLIDEGGNGYFGTVGEPYKILLYANKNSSKIEVNPETRYVRSYAFRGSTYLTKVSFGDKVESVGEMAFEGCSYLDEVDFGSSPVRIGRSAFYNCKYLRRVSALGAVEIGEEAFYYCKKLEQFSFSGALESIGDRAFQYCEKLDISLDFESCPLKYIGEQAFSHTSVNEIILPDCIERVGFQAFYATSLKCNTDSVGNRYLGNSSNPYIVFYDSCGGAAEVTVAEGTRIIYDGAFNMDSSVTSITLPEGLTVIGEYAFAECGNLREINIPSTVIEIGDYAFAATGSLKELILPEGLKFIGSHAFKKSALDSIIIPASVECIGIYAFEGVRIQPTFQNPVGWYFTSEENGIYGEGCDAADYRSLTTDLTENYFEKYFRNK